MYICLDGIVCLTDIFDNDKIRCAIFAWWFIFLKKKKKKNN